MHRGCGASAAYDQYEAAYQAKTVSGKATYLFLYVLPGVLAFVCINVEPNLCFERRWLSLAYQRDTFSMFGSS